MFNTSRSYIVPSVFAPSDIGVFSIYPKEDDKYFGSYWDTCREQFAKKFLEDSYGFFLSVDDKKENLIPFIHKCETILNLSSRTEFYETDMSNVIFLRPHKFWMPCYMRRSLLTLICRIGIFYQNKNFENHLLGNVEKSKVDKVDNCYEFAKKTRNAIIRFFAGYNTYIGFGPNREEIFPEKHGWVVEFQNKNKEYIKKVLVSSNNDCDRLRFFGTSMFLD